MAVTKTSLPDRHRMVSSPLGRLLLMIGTRGLDQLALGAASLLIARRTGTVGFAPFAVIFIIYALTAQIGDRGLAFAILRTPANAMLATGARSQRNLLNAVVALLSVMVGLRIGGDVGIVVAIAGLALFTGPIVFVGRATLQWSGHTKRLSMGEGAGAAAFLLATVAFVHDAEDLLLFGGICVGKHLVEMAVQGWPSSVFEADGSTVRATGVWASQIVTYLAANVDYLLVGVLLGEAALSIYAIGFRLASAFSSVVAAPLTRTWFVDFANSERMQEQHDRLLRQIAVFGVLGVVGTFVVAGALPTILGSGWEQTRSVTAVLGIALPWRLLLGPVVALGLTKGRARRVVGWEVVRTVGLIAAIVVGSSSVFDVAGAVAAATILTIGWSYRRASIGAGIEPSRALEAVGIITSASIVLSLVLI